MYILKPSKRPQQGAVGVRGVRGARSSPAMFRKKAKGKDDPPAQPRVSDEYGEKLTRSLSMEIRELRIREKEILSQLKSRGVKADERETRPLEPPQTSVDSPRPLTLRPNTTHPQNLCQKKVSSDSEDGTDGLGRPGSPNEKRLLAAAPTSESLKRRASHGHLTGLAVGNDDDVLEDSQHGSGKALSAIQREESRQRERVNIIVIDLLFSAARGRLSACIRKAATLEAAGLYLTDLNCCDYDKRTPLHLSTAEGSFRVSEWLLKEKKVNPNAIDRFGNTPLQGAIWGDHKVIVNLLVEHGGQLLEVRRRKKKRKTTTKSHHAPAADPHSPPSAETRTACWWTTSRCTRSARLRAISSPRRPPPSAWRTSSGRYHRTPWSSQRS